MSRQLSQIQELSRLLVPRTSDPPRESDFRIPKEMLRHVAALMASARTTHDGDDHQRDREIAASNGWPHRWP